MYAYVLLSDYVWAMNLLCSLEINHHHFLSTWAVCKHLRLHLYLGCQERTFTDVAEQTEEGGKKWKTGWNACSTWSEWPPGQRLLGNGVEKRLESFTKTQDSREASKRSEINQPCRSANAYMVFGACVWRLDATVHG